ASSHNHAASNITSGTLGVARGGTGASTLGAGVVYHSASGTGALSIATADNIVSAIGETAVANASNAANADKVNNLTVQTAVPANAVFTDTKNTAGSTNSTSKLFLIGATSNGSSATNPQTYSNSNVYATNGALVASTYNGYTLGAACAKGVDTSIASGSTSANLPTSAAVASYVASQGGGGGTVDMPTGTITMFAGSTAPSGYLLCQGQAVSRTTYTALFSVIGTAYGAGDGSTTFNLPNLQGRFPLGKSSGHALASTGGAETHTLTVNEIPAHTHGSKSLTGETSAYGDTGLIGGTASPSGIISKSGSYSYAPDWANTPGYKLKVDATHEHDSVGGGQAHSIMPPFVTVNYIIKS
ncbi:MAG: tail fiber protein, partial [Atopobiaceae bacterium]|nr:tail fiber protein [Atopobiaceae bacterium]